MRIEFYTYEADFHCVAHAEARFGKEALANDTARDSEGNPVHAVFSTDEHPDYEPACYDCLSEEISRARTT